MIRYDLAKRLKNSDFKEYLNGKKLKSDNYWDTKLNDDEFWFIFWHARFATPIETASNDAESYTESYFPKPYHQNKADAYRHAVWNALICKESAPKKEWVSECLSITKGFTDAHESGATKPDNFTDDEWEIDKSMDYHNNSVGRSYFKTVAY